MSGNLERGITARNPVWVVPLGLPAALFATQSWDMTILFAVSVIVVVIITHLVSMPIERWLPPDLGIVAMLITGGVVITIAELVLGATGIVLTGRALYLYRAITVSGVMLWPALIGKRDEPFSHRMNRVTGLALGFGLGVALLAIIRVPLVLSGVRPAHSLSFALFVLALGRILVNLVVMRRERSRKEERS